MSFQAVNPGRDIPNEINVIVEIPMDSPAIKYEVDKESGAIFVDRILKTAMHYPCNYGYVPHTLCGDGDPVDVLVVMPLPLVPGSVVRCRPVGVLNMAEDEALLGLVGFLAVALSGVLLWKALAGPRGWEGRP